MRGYAKKNRDGVDRLLDSGEANVLFLLKTKIEDLKLLSESEGQVLTIPAPVVNINSSVEIAFV